MVEATFSQWMQGAKVSSPYGSGSGDIFSEKSL